MKNQVLSIAQMQHLQELGLDTGDASGLEGQFSDSDKKTAENFGIDYMDVSEFVNVYGKGI